MAMLRLKRKVRRRIRRVCAGAFAVVMIAAGVHMLLGKPQNSSDRNVGATADSLTAATVIAQPVTVHIDQIPEAEAIDPLREDKEALARMVWGEARGCSTTEQAAVVWCALNRLDSTDPFYAGCVTICDIVAQPAQFVGYNPDHPLDEEILALVDDVVSRWLAEKDGADNVGRVLPAEYLYFTGDGKHNHFRTEYTGGQTWEWTLYSPYEE